MKFVTTSSVARSIVPVFIHCCWIMFLIMVLHSNESIWYFCDPPHQYSSLLLHSPESVFLGRFLQELLEGVHWRYLFCRLQYPVFSAPSSMLNFVMLLSSFCWNLLNKSQIDLRELFCWLWYYVLELLLTKLILFFLSN